MNNPRDRGESGFKRVESVDTDIFFLCKCPHTTLRNPKGIHNHGVI